MSGRGRPPGGSRRGSKRHGRLEHRGRGGGRGNVSLGVDAGALEARQPGTPPEQRSEVHMLTVPRGVEDANPQDAALNSRLWMQLRIPTEEEKLTAPSSLHTAAVENQQAAASEASPFMPSRGSKDDGEPIPRAATQKLSPNVASDDDKPPPPPETSSTTTRPPHPYDSGKVCHVNICPVCQKYTVTELDRPARRSPASRPIKDEALRARFECGLCEKVFDLGIALFDPRGVLGLTLYRGEDRFQPPVPPAGKYPCPRCLKSTHTPFQRMVCYLREESRVPCAPACPADRLKWSDDGEEEEPKMGSQNAQ